MEEANKVVVLVVEDEFLLRVQVVDPLEEAGFHVLTASTAEEAIAKLQREGDGIRALVTDVNLGVGATGWDVAQQARELNPLLPVVYTTSYGPEDWAAHGVPNSVHIGKPFLPLQLLTAIAQLLNTTAPFAPSPPE